MLQKKLLIEQPMNLTKPNSESDACVVVISGISDQTFLKNRQNFMEELFKHFPKIKLKRVSVAASGLVFCTFITAGEAKNVVDNWRPN